MPIGLAPALSQAHSTSFYPNQWASSSNVNYGFDNDYPSGSYRYRVTDGKNQWNSAGGSVEPDFFGILSDADLIFYNPCYSPQSGVLWFNRPGSIAGEVKVCISGSGKVIRFSLAIDPDAGGSSWYTGTGDAPSNKMDLWSVATHEFGHVTGWYGHFSESESICPNSGSRHTMCPAIYTGTERQRTLETHDTHTFDTAY